MLNLTLAQMLIILPTILIALTVHELSHGMVALLLGDDTAKKAGRITLNPLKHVDLFGFIMIVVVGFGWARPVQFSPVNFKKPIRDEILVAFAGPVSNLLLGFLGTIVFRIVLPRIDLILGSPPLIIEILSTFISINIGLAVFNAIPIPPLDGSHLYLGSLARTDSKVAQLFLKYGFLILVGIIVVERFLGYHLLPLGRVIDVVIDLMLRILG